MYRLIDTVVSDKYTCISQIVEIFLHMVKQLKGHHFFSVSLQ